MFFETQSRPYYPSMILVKTLNLPEKLPWPNSTVHRSKCELVFKIRLTRTDFTTKAAAKLNQSRAEFINIDKFKYI